MRLASAAVAASTPPVSESTLHRPGSASSNPPNRLGSIDNNVGDSSAAGLSDDIAGVGPDGTGPGAGNSFVPIQAIAAAPVDQPPTITWNDDAAPSNSQARFQRLRTIASNPRI